MVGVHYPKFASTTAAQACGKPIWSSEDGPWKGTWAGAVALAKAYNRNYIVGKMTKTVIWSVVSSYYDNLPLPSSGVMRANTPWSGHYEVQPALWATAHTTQFAQPGWKYLDGGCGLLAGGGSYVTLKAPHGAGLQHHRRNDGCQDESGSRLSTNGRSIARAPSRLAHQRRTLV